MTIMRACTMAIALVVFSHSTLSGQVTSPPSASGTDQTVELIRGLQDSNRGVRRKAAIALGDTKDTRAIPPLHAARSDRDEQLQRLSENSLKKIFAALAARRDADAVRALRSFVAVTNQYDSLIQPAEDAIFRIVSALADSKDAAAVEPLLIALQPPRTLFLSRVYRNRAIQGLVSIGDVRAVEPLIATLADSEHREEAARALGAFADPRAVEPLLPLLTDKFIRREVAVALGRIRDARAVEPLIAGLHDSDLLFRIYAISALGRIRDVRAVEPLIALLSDAQVRTTAAAALGELRDSRAVEPLIAALVAEMKEPATPSALEKLVGASALTKQRPDFQEPFIKAFQTIGPPAIGPLVAALQNGVVTVIAAEVLGESDDPRAVEALMAGLKRKDLRIVAGAYRFFIRRGQPGTEPVLIEALDLQSDVLMANDFLSSGNPVLEQAAKAWNAKQGVLGVTRIGSAGPRWGERRQ